uniref:IncH1 plasmid conjugative transfer protein HtdW n=1 Tax=Escherichia coli TaxID=562 RepID=A0A6G6AKZ3_ECOLX|nr:IncHI-type conjugal transfer protein TrhW [Escherichia coli]QID22391.1 IncH1 plasmid conjugative transfer protein HtdW [Escherichia coli]
MRSFELKTTIKPLASCLAFYALISTAVASPQYQQVADDIARQAQVLGAQIPVPHASEGPLPSGSLDSTDTKKYIRQAEAMKKNGDLSQQTNRGYVPGMNADSVQAVIDHTQAIRAQSNNSEAVNDIIRRRDEIQGNSQLSESALKSVENKPEVMRSQSSNIEKMFGSSGITAADFERKIDSSREEVLSTENGITIFASFSLPDYVLEDLLRTASEHKARVVFNGLKKGTTRLPETQAAINQLVVKGKFDSPLITIDPDAFNQYQITQVPTIISREQSRFAKMVGSFNVDFFQRELARKPDQDLFPIAGTTYPVEEKSISKELEERAQKYDWDGAKKRAVADTWKNQYMVNLPPAQEHKEWLIDPTIRVTQDVKDKQGRVIASAGELINPLARFPQNLTMIIFDPMNPGQLEWAEKQYRQRLGSGQVMPMFTRIKQENGWDHLNDLREKFNGKVFKVNEQIIARFQIKNTPALISTEKEKFRITQFSEAEIRGIGTKIAAEEN